MAIYHHRKKAPMKVFLAIIPEEGHLNPDHEIRTGIEKHINETGCHFCISFMQWHLNKKYARFSKKPRMCSCPTAISITKNYLAKIKRAAHLRQVM